MVHASEEDHARRRWTTSRRGQDSPWKSQSEWQRTEINGESTSMVWPTLGSRTAKDQIRSVVPKCQSTEGTQSTVTVIKSKLAKYIILRSETGVTEMDKTPGNKTSKELQKHTHNHLSGTTQVGQYQKKHSPTHTHPDHQTSFINFLHLLRSIASSLFNLTVLFRNLSLGSLWSTSWSGTLYFIHFFIQSLSSFSNRCP